MKNFDVVNFSKYVEQLRTEVGRRRIREPKSSRDVLKLLNYFSDKFIESEGTDSNALFERDVNLIMLLSDKDILFNKNDDSK